MSHCYTIPDQAKAIEGEITRKHLILADIPVIKRAPRSSIKVSECKSYVELANGSIVDEEEMEAAELITELTKSIAELAKVLL